MPRSFFYCGEYQETTCSSVSFIESEFIGGVDSAIHGGERMHIPDCVEKVFGFLIKMVFGLFGLAIALQLLCVWTSHLHRSPQTMLAVFLALPIPSVVAYLILRFRRPRREVHARRGAERTPILPQTRGEA
jgi:hypothetical protein